MSAVEEVTINGRTYTRPTDAQMDDFARSMRAAIKSRRPSVNLSAPRVAILRELGTAPGERTFLPGGWPRDGVAVVVLAHLRRTDANWTWDKSRKLLTVDGAPMMVAEYATAHGLEVAKPAKVATTRPKVAKVAPAPVVVAEVVAPEVVAEVVPEPAPAPVVVAEVVPEPTVVVDAIAHPSPAAAATGGTLLADYLARLLHPPKLAYATELAAHLLHGAPCPQEPATDWAPKVTAKVRRYATAA